MTTAGTTVAVTGASGFLGRRLVRALDACGVDVLPVARRPAPWLPRPAVVVADYAETPIADVVVHLAEPNERVRALEAGGRHVAAVRAVTKAVLGRAGRLIYASSGVVYGTDTERPRRPDDPTPADDPYARGKLSCEALVTGAGGTVVRLANLFGLGMADSTVVSAILSQIPGEGPLYVFDDAPVRDFLCVDDAAEALALICRTEEVCGIFNVGYGRGLSIGKFAQLALAVAGEAHRPVQATRPGGRPSSLVLDISATEQRLGWRPRHDPAAALSQLISIRRTTAQ